MSALSDPTFSNYDQHQARRYAESRLSYSAPLYNTIIDYHVKSGGRRNVLVDVGCGPGNATRDLATWFDHAVGLDPSVEMINRALQLGGRTKSGQHLKYAVSTAENISHGITDVLPNVKDLGRVDLLTAAMAAHWFDMPQFWNEASRIARSGGTVALWTCSSLYCHPSTFNADAVQKILFELEREILAPYELPPNRLSRDPYKDLILPWDLDDESLASDFPISQFQRLEWDRDGILTNGDSFFSFSDEMTLDELETGLGTASMVTRWRKAHPDLVGTENDCVEQTMTKVRSALGVGDEENPKMTVGSGVAILLFKRK